MRDDAVQPVRHPPVRWTQQLHHGGNEHHAHQGGVDEDGRGKTQAEDLEDVERVTKNKRAEEQIMMAAAAVMTRAVLARPSATAVELSPVMRHSSRIRDSKKTS